MTPSRAGLRRLVVASALCVAAMTSARASVDPLVSRGVTRVTGGIAVAATCVAHADPADGGPDGGVLHLEGVPPGADIVQALLYWTILSDTSPVPAGSPTLDGQALAVEPIGELPVTPCFAQANTGAFRADVTALVAGDGDLRLAGLPGDGTEDGDLTEGATLLVIWCGPGGLETEVVLYDGLGVTHETDRVLSQHLAGFGARSVSAPRATLVLAAGNGQGHEPLDTDPDPLVFDGVDLDALDLTILSGGLCPPLGLYDRTVIDVSAEVAPGDETADLELRAANDCHSVAAIALAVTTDPGVVVTEPSALDVRPGAEPLRVAKEPGGLRVTWEGLGPGTTCDLWRGDLGDFASHGAFGACDLAVPAADVPDDPGSHYFVAAARACSAATSSAGRDSFGVERALPPATGRPACP